MAEEQLIGKVTHYYSKLGVAIVELSGTLSAGDRVHVKGHLSDFEQPVDSMQVEHQNVENAKKGDVIGLKVSEKVREGDEVYKV
ncbi:translation elongation factor-like protein [Candidatus Azambacteria bacterium]|nr:translation elongation factor-like protein [Candidatus Azambacteria bacterium]MBI2587933.1 translation elongation factor-like protein [Candidatus Azambacteria bacterium]